jgi:AraC-like DNA-binding protein
VDHPVSYAHLAGALVAIGLGLWLVVRRRPLTLADRFALLLLVVYSISAANEAIEHEEWWRTWPHLLGLTTGFTFLVPPLFYLYVSTATGAVRRFRKLHLLHFLPFAQDFVFSTPFLFQPGADKLEHVETYMQNGIEPPSLPLMAIISTYVLLYAVLTLRAALGYHKRAPGDSPAVGSRKLAALRSLSLLVFLHPGAWIVASACYLLGVDGTTMSDSLNALPVFAGLAVYVGLTAHLSPAALAVVAAPERCGDEKYGRNRLDDRTADEIVEAAREAMERDRLFARPDLTLRELAAELDLPANCLSQAINRRLGVGFRDYLSRLRVREAKRALTDPAQETRGVLEIAFDCGFSSKSAFNATFKRLTGATPTEHRRRVFEERIPSRQAS